MPTPSALKTAVAIRHVHFEDLGIFEDVLRDAEYRIHYYDIGVDELWTLDPLLPDLLVVLGGPVSVHDGDLHPFLTEERLLLATRLAGNRPTLGICLGAQQIAATLGAKVAPMGSKEIGFAELDLSDEGSQGPLRHLEGAHVLHWHGDAFEVPVGATLLASTSICPTQAFALGRNVLALQFHPEVDPSAGMERWLIGHAVELAAAAIDPQRLRDEAAIAGGALRYASSRMLESWLQQLRA